MSDIKVSIVTTVLNRKDTIADTIASVRDQSYVQIEHIVQDGGSTDGTHEIIQALTHDRLKLQSCRDRGIYDGINRGMARATGDVIGLLHSDDVFADRGIISRVVECFQNPEVDAVYGDLVYVHQSDPERILRHWHAGAYKAHSLKFGWMPPHPTFYMRRHIIEKFGPYDVRYKIAADYEAMLRWIKHGELQLSYVPDVLVRMRWGGESNRSLASLINKSREDYHAIRQHEIGGIATLALKNLRKIFQFRL